MFEVKTISRPEEELRQDIFTLFASLSVGMLKQDFYYTAIDADGVFNCFQKAIEKQRASINEDAQGFDWSLPE